MEDSDWEIKHHMTACPRCGYEQKTHTTRLKRWTKYVVIAEKPGQFSCKSCSIVFTVGLPTFIEAAGSC